MKITVYDPLKAFPAFLPYLGQNHEVLWIDVPVTSEELRWQHIRSDLVWYEFCDEHFFQMMRGPKECSIVNRLHSYELFTDVPGRVDWSKVDVMAASSDYVKGMLESHRHTIDFPPIHVLSNGPDLSKLTVPPNKKYGKRIALVARLNYKKNIPLAIYCMAALKDQDYELHVFGGSQDLRFDFYLKHLVANLGLDERVLFHGEKPHEEVVAAMEFMDYTLNTSLFESFGQGIMEGIGCGCLPVIHDFPGARGRFQGMGEVFFSTPEQFSALMENYALYSDESLREMANRNINAIQQYDFEAQCRNLDGILAKVEEGLDGYK